MRSYQRIVFVFSLLIIYNCSKDKSDAIDTPLVNPAAEGMYFPPIDGSSWEAVSPSELNWNEAEVQELKVYLEEKNTKGFMILKNGRRGYGRLL